MVEQHVPHVAWVSLYDSALSTFGMERPWDISERILSAPPTSHLWRFFPVHVSRRRVRRTIVACVRRNPMFDHPCGTADAQVAPCRAEDTDVPWFVSGLPRKHLFPRPRGGGGPRCSRRASPREDRISPNQAFPFESDPNQKRLVSRPGLPFGSNLRFRTRTPIG